MLNFCHILQFIYADKFDVLEEPQALHLLHLGLKYEVQPLVDKCEAFIAEGISPEHAVEVYEAAKKYYLIDLMDKAGGIIAWWASLMFLKLTKV